MLGINMLGNTRVQSVIIELSGCILTDAPLAGGIFLPFQNTPSSLSNNISVFTILNSRFLSRCGLIDFTKHNTKKFTDINGSGIFAIFDQNSYFL